MARHEAKEGMMELDDVIDVKLLDSIPQQPQVQCSTTDQLVALQVLASKFGLYDAGDWLKRHLEGLRKA